MYKSILLPIDIGHPSSWKKALPMALDLAKNHNAELHVLNVVPNFGMSIVGGFFPEGFEKTAIENAKEALAKCLAENIPNGASSKGHVALGNIYEEIINAANKLGCDLIIMAAHRPELKDYLLGPNAARVVRHAAQSVMVVRD